MGSFQLPHVSSCAKCQFMELEYACRWPYVTINRALLVVGDIYACTSYIYISLGTSKAGQERESPIMTDRVF